MMPSMCTFAVKQTNGVPTRAKSQIVVLGYKLLDSILLKSTNKWMNHHWCLKTSRSISASVYTQEYIIYKEQQTRDWKSYDVYLPSAVCNWPVVLIKI